MLTATSGSLVTAAVKRGRLKQAAAFVASRFRLARQQALTTSASVGIAFDNTGGRWTFRVCRDGNGNGLRRAELGGLDRCEEGPFDVTAMFPSVSFAVDPSVRGPDGEPGSADPIRLGNSDIASFSPAGSCTAGSVFIQATDGTLYLVRVAGVTGRTRVLRYDAPARTWRDE
jgi:hypothetical protein